MHKRTAIRNSVAAMLAARPELAGRVDKSRVRPTQDAELPVALVYALQEQSSQVTLGRTLSRTLTLVIEIRVAATEALDDQVDALCVAVETALAADPNLGLLALDAVLTSTQIGINGDATTPHGVALLTYTILYRTGASQPGV